MAKGLDNYIESITAVFKKNQPPEAHKQAAPLLLEMAKDKEAFMEIVRRNILSDQFFSAKRINPVIAMPIVNNTYITLVANFWLPLPDRSTTVSHQSVHHHGKLLLTSASPYGPGYESILFKQGFRIDPVTEKTQMVIDKDYKNHLHNVEFIDANTPHIVFYPAELSVTYALWTYNQRSFMDTIRKNRLVQKNKQYILKLIGLFGKIKKSATNAIEYFDFFPHNNELRAMKDRVMYAVGSNENFIQNVFYILQQIGFSEFDLIERALAAYPDQIKKTGLRYLDKLKKGERIEDSFEDIHLNVAKINFSKKELLNVLQS